MYSGTLSPRDRAGPAVGVVLVHLALGAMLLGLSGTLNREVVESALKTIQVRDLPPPPPPRPRARPEPARAKRDAPAAPAKIAEATPVVAPSPVIVIPAPTVLVAAPLPNLGTAPSQGAATAGSGSGAGGSGNGLGGGGSGDGNGGGGTGEGDGTYPRPLFRPLNPRGFPRQLVEPLPYGARVMIIFTVQLNGRISDCGVRQSSGEPALDALLCQVATQRFRYDPARRGDGSAYVAKAAYAQVF